MNPTRLEAGPTGSTGFQPVAGGTGFQPVILRESAARFVDLLHRHVIQGTLCAPEYVAIATGAAGS